MEACKIAFAITDLDWIPVLTEIALECRLEIVSSIENADVVVIDRNSGRVPNKLTVSLGNPPDWKKTGSISLALPLNRAQIIRGFQQAVSRWNADFGLGLGYWSRGGFFINLNERQCWYSQQPVVLTPTEFSILECLIRSKGARMSREQILKASIEHNVCDQTLDTHLSNMKKKIPALSQWIHSLRGEGIRLQVEEISEAR